MKYKECIRTAPGSLMGINVNTHAGLRWRPNPEEMNMNENFATNNDENNEINRDQTVPCWRGNSSFDVQDQGLVTTDNMQPHTNSGAGVRLAMKKII